MKKSCFTYFFVLFAFVGAFAQSSISVKSFRALPNDMTASSLEGKRIDQNGEVAALIKVVTTQTGFTFEGGTLGIVDTKQEAGEVWVWVPRAARKITIKHPQLGVLRDYAYPIEIEAERTYEMVLTTGKVVTTIEEEVREQYLIFQVEPKDAVLEVDDQLWPVSAEGTARKFVKFGTYTYRVQAPNYYPDAGTVTVDDPIKKKTVPVKLKPNFGWVEVKGGNVQDAAVYIDNAYIGKAPCKSDILKSGEHTVRIARAMYAPYTERVVVKDNETTLLSPYLTADFARVTLTVEGDAEIWVNGERKGTHTWTGDLASGTYRMECRLANHEPSSITKEIANTMDGETITLPAPKPIYGSLNVESTPDFAKIFVDGKDMGETPNFISQILIGQHEVKLTKEGYADYTETVTIAKGERKQVNATLSNGSTPQSAKPQQPQPTQPKPQQPVAHKSDNGVFFTMANAAFSIAPQTSFGLTAGWTKQFGGYLSVNSNFSFQDADYECDSEGNISSLTTEYSYSGTQKTSRLSATAGLVVRVADPVYAYAGVGYGFRNLYWELNNGKWVKNADHSWQGLALDAGLMLHFNGFGFSLGVQTVGVKYLEAKVGIGYTLKY